METYKRGETPKLYANTKTEVIDDDGNLSDGVLTNPATSIKIIIEDSAGQVVQVLADMSGGGAATGKFYYTGYTIAADAPDGVFNYEVRATDGTSSVAIGSGSFKVKEQLS